MSVNQGLLHIRAKDLLGINTKSRSICLHKPPQDIFRSLINIGATSVFWGVSFKGNLGKAKTLEDRKRITRTRIATDLWKLDLEDINLVEEQNDRGAKEPPRIYHGFKKCQRLRHSVLREEFNKSISKIGSMLYLIFFFEEHLIIFAQRRTKDDRCH